MEQGKDKDTPYRLFTILTFIVFIVWGLGVYLASGSKAEESIFDGISALFSGLAFAGLFCALSMQRQELSLQREELKATRDELELTRKAAQDQADIQMKALLLKTVNIQLTETIRRIKYMEAMDASAGHNPTREKLKSDNYLKEGEYTERLEALDKALLPIFNKHIEVDAIP